MYLIAKQSTSYKLTNVQNVSVMHKQGPGTEASSQADMLSVCLELESGPPSDTPPLVTCLRPEAGLYLMSGDSPGSPASVMRTNMFCSDSIILQHA